MAKKPLSRLLPGAPSDMSRAGRRAALHMLKDEKRRADRIVKAAMMSGAGFTIDNRMRTLLDACNDDVRIGAEVPFPNIWDVFSGFVRRVEAGLASPLVLLEERDHAFAPGDFFAFREEPAIRDAARERLLGLPVGIIHNYSCLDGPDEATFSREDGSAYVLSGIAMIRHGGHLHWCAIGGEKVDLDAVTSERRRTLAENAEAVRRANPHASENRIRDILNPTAKPLDGTGDAWLTWTMGLFNLETMSHEIRTVVRDWSVTLSVFSDHFEERLASAYGRLTDVTRMVDKAMAEVEKAGLMFDVAEMAFTLPAYFTARVGHVGMVERVTALGDQRSGQARKHALKAPPDLRVLVKQVATLESPSSHAGAGGYAPPRFRVEVDGFWRRLKPESEGRDAEGNPVKGRTWVRGHARWKDRPSRTATVYVKSPIGNALRKAGASEAALKA